MREFTPTTEHIRNACGWNRDYIVKPDEFDRWFAEEIRKAKEEAWKEGMNYAMPPDAILLYSDNPYTEDKR